MEAELHVMFKIHPSCFQKDLPNFPGLVSVNLRKERAFQRIFITTYPLTSELKRPELSPRGASRTKLPRWQDISHTSPTTPRFRLPKDRGRKFCPSEPLRVVNLVPGRPG